MSLPKTKASPGTKGTMGSAKPDDLNEPLGNEPQMAAAPVVEPAPVNFSPFDQLGHIRKDLSADTATIEAMPDTQRSVFFRMLADATAAEECEAKLGELRTAVARAMYAQTAAFEAAARNAAPVTQQELLAAVLHAHDPDAPAPEKKRPVNPKPAAELKAAEAELIRLRDELTQAQLDLKTLSRIRGESIGQYMKTMAPVTDESVRRAYLDRSGAERLGIANGTITPPPVPPPPKWPIEQGYAARASAPKKVPFVGSNLATKPLGHKF